MRESLSLTSASSNNIQMNMGIWGFWAKFYDELNLMFDLFLVLHNGGGADINKLQ